VTIKRPTRPFKRRPGRPSPDDDPNNMVFRTGESIIRLRHFSTAPDIIALQDPGFPATALRRRAAAKEYFKIHRAELGTRDAALREVARRFHIDAETFVNWMNRSRRAR
jgi:hypothetical protein